MIARLLCILILFIQAGSGLHAQAPATDAFKVQKATAKAEAQKMSQLLVEKNYEEFAQYVHPNIASMAGGQPKMVVMLKSTMSEMEKQGVSITGSVIKDPVMMVKAGNQFQAVIPQDMKLKMGTGTLEQTTYIIGISEDGKKWTFIDTSNKTMEQLKQVLPSLSPKITIPEKSAPVFNKD